MNHSTNVTESGEFDEQYLRTLRDKIHAVYRSIFWRVACVSLDCWRWSGFGGLFCKRCAKKWGLK